MNKFIKSSYAILIYLFLYFPIAIVIIFSFNNAKHSLLWHGFTLKWYHDLFQNTMLLQVAWHSLLLGVIAATLATMLGTLIAIVLFRYNFSGKKLIHGIIGILIVMPEIVIAVSLLLLYGLIKIPLGFWTLLFAHIALGVPFVTVTVSSRIATLNQYIFEAARDLGASDFVIVSKIIIPLLLPAIMAGWLLSFTLSLDNIIISYFVSGPSFDILPLKIYSMVRLGVKPEVNALCTLMLIFTISAVMVSYQGIFKKRKIK